MNQKETEEYGVWLKHNGRNCCQSTIEAITHDDPNITPTDRQMLMRIASGFRTGMGGMQATCGALCGAVMAAGLYIRGAETGNIANIMHKRFTELSGDNICKRLKTRQENGKPLCECDDCVRHAIRAFSENIIR